MVRLQQRLALRRNGLVYELEAVLLAVVVGADRVAGDDEPALRRDDVLVVIRKTEREPRFPLALGALVPGRAAPRG